MPFQPSREQRAIVSELEGPIAAILPLARRHQGAAEASETWAALNDLGLFGLSVSEDSGGVGLGVVEEALLATSLGRAVASPSVFATLAAVHTTELADGFSIGDRVAAGFAGVKTTVILDGDARWLLVRDGAESALYACNGDLAVMGESPWQAELVTPQSLGEPVAHFDPKGLMRVRLIEAAALAGVADRATEMAVDYAKIREQFGRPIGSFQAVKHHCANMATSARLAVDLVGFAAVAIEEGRSEAALLTESAFVTAATAALENCGRNIQIHGGIGFSDEADVHLLLKQSQLLIAVGGGIEAAIARLSGNVLAA